MKDSYVAEMKATILSISPHVAIVDITHAVEKFDVRKGAFILASASTYFPKGTIHVAVVDPGVGTERRGILIQTKQGFLVGPDNGVLALTAREQTVEHIHAVTNRRLMRQRVTNTFHGRDIFAPAAAHLANGTPATEFGPELQEIVNPEFARLVRKRTSIVGEIMHVDDFGNVTTNFRERDLESMKIKGIVRIRIAGARLELKLCQAYNEVKAQESLAIVGSHSFLEIAVNQGNAAETLRIKVGDRVTLCHS